MDFASIANVGLGLVLEKDAVASRPKPGDADPGSLVITPPIFLTLGVHAFLHRAPRALPCFARLINR
jgi:hypothetical protein